MSFNVTQRELELLASVYDAALDPALWPEVLEQLIDAVEASGGALFAADPNASEFSIEAVTSIWTPEILGEYRSRFHVAEGPLYQNLNRFQARRLLFDDQILEGVCVARELPARKWMNEEMGLTHRAAARLQRENIWFDVIVFQYKLPQRCGGRESVLRKTDIFMNHLAKVVEINRPFMILKQRYQAVLQALDRYHLGVFVLGPRGDVIVRNRAADQILESNGALSLTTRHRLTVNDRSKERDLRAAIERAVSTARAEDTHAETLLSIPRRHERDPLLLDICPAKDPGVELDAGFNGAFVFAIDPSQLYSVSTRGMDVLYGLTDAETDVLDHLIKGYSTSDTADSRGVSIETVRSQAKSLLQKVGVSDRTQLIARAARVNLPID